jgi:hypothetical protein
MSVSVSVHQRLPDRTQATWLDSAPDLSCTNSTQAYVLDVEHQPRDLAVGGSNPSRRAKRTAQRLSSKRSSPDRIWPCQSFECEQGPLGRAGGRSASMAVDCQDLHASLVPAIGVVRNESPSQEGGDVTGRRRSLPPPASAPPSGAGGSRQRRRRLGRPGTRHAGAGGPRRTAGCCCCRVPTARGR